MACTAAGCAGGPTPDVAVAQLAAAEVRCPETPTGVLAALHFLRPGNGRACLHAILAGKVLVD